MKTPLLLCIAFLLVQRANSQLSGPNAASSFSAAALSGSNATWMNVNNADLSDDQYATFGDIAGGVGSFTDYLVVTNFSFTVPEGSVIKGIEATVEKSDPNGLTSDYSIRIIKNGIFGTAERSTGTAYPSVDKLQIYGGNGDLWGETWTADDIMNAKFGIAIAAQRNNTGGVTAGRIDQVRITIYFGYTTLPLSLQSFSVTREGKTAMVYWNTSNEMNIDHFDVERSTDGRTFSLAGTVNALNRSNSAYSFRDVNPFGGRSFYRLRIYETGIADKFSKVVPINFDKVAVVYLYPSPWNLGKDLQLDNSVNEELTVQFFTNSGQLLGKTTTRTNKVVMPSLPVTSGNVYYKVLDKENRIKGSGTLVIN